MAKILVTGGAGFIGSHLSQMLLAQEHEIVIVDNLDSYYPPSIKQRNLDEIQKTGNYTFIKEDAGHYKAMKKLIRDEHVEVIFHEASRPGVRTSIAEPMTTHKKNVDVTLNLLLISAESEVEFFVNASSSSVYGEPSFLPLDETHDTNPRSPYGVSKLAAEQYTKVFYDIYGLPTVSLRYFTVYGPRMRPDLAIFLFTHHLLNSTQPTIFGDGEQTRDFTYVDDIVKANLGVLEKRPRGEIINIGSGSQVSINQLFQILLDITGTTLMPVYTEKAKGDVS